MTNDVQHATFIAAFPAIQSAIKCGQDTWRIQLDIPASELSEAKKLLDWQGVVLMVTVVPMNLQNKCDQEDGKSNGQGRLAGRSKWQPTRASAQS